MIADATPCNAMTRSVEQLVHDVRAGGANALRAAARLMSIVTDQPQRLPQLLAGSRHWPQPRLVLGVTGAPGSGKSTLTDHLAAEFRLLHPAERLGIVAVDPSSPFTGGALLGDRVRMMRHATDPNVFIRSLASRGHLGGLALGAMGVVRVMGLLGCDVVMIETVGVGQSEVEIARNADQVVVVLAPGQGDSIQMLKAGLMEAGDLFVVNKADRPDAAKLHQELIAMLDRARWARLDLAQDPGEPLACHGAHQAGRLGRSEHGGSTPAPADSEADSPAVLLCSAARHEGIRQLAGRLDDLAARHAPQWQQRRRAQALSEIRLGVLESVTRRVERLIDRDRGQARLRQILEGECLLERMVDELMHDASSPAMEKVNR
jgi:LAO/AO transport system ATPase